MILVVDDERKLVDLLRAYLEEEGFRVATASNGQEGLIAARQEKPDLVIVDWMMPELDGLDFTRIIRRESGVPIIMLTARDEDVDKVLGLEIGADDYVTKPFSPRELVARVRATLRRASGEPASSPVVRCAGIVMDRTAHTVTVRGEAVALTPTEFDLLSAFMTYPGRAFSRMELLEAVQGYAYEAYERTVDAHVKNLRKKIEVDPSAPKYLQTVIGVGYRFSEDASEKP
jgi:DNA-binding response OmpR family regulator